MADGVITRIDIERRRDASINGGHYFCATFSYDFQDPAANRLYGSWYKNFSSEDEARQFSERELPVGKRVVVRFNPKTVPSIVWNWTPGLTAATGQPVSQFSGNEKRTPK